MTSSGDGIIIRGQMLCCRILIDHFLLISALETSFDSMFLEQDAKLDGSLTLSSAISLSQFCHNMNQGRSHGVNIGGDK